MKIDRENKPLSATMLKFYQKYIVGLEEDKPDLSLNPENRLFSNPVTKLDIALIEFLKDGIEPEIEEDQMGNIELTSSLLDMRATKK